ncbi:MAG TPA: hypothetical protein VFZ41_01525 [Solirubrobacterales bacterium]
MRTLAILIASLAAAAALVLPGCGDSGTAETAKGSGDAASEAALSNKVKVTMGEWFFRVDHARVKAGKVTVTARNGGDIEHELIVVKTDLPADEMPMTPEGLDVDKAGELVIGEPHGHGDEHGDEHMDGADEHMDGADEHMDDGETTDSDSAAGESTTTLAVSHSSSRPETVLVDAGHDEAEKGDADEHMDEVAEEGHLMPGETRRYQVDLKPGRYVLLCSIPGHYQMGQYVGLVAVR